MNLALMPLAPAGLPQTGDGFDYFLRSVRSIPVLELEQEQELARRYRSTGDADAARKLALSNLRYVLWVARRYRGYGLPLADLMQEGTLGLLKAIKRFDPDCGVRLISYASRWIQSEIHDYILRNWQIVRRATTKAQRKLFFKRQRITAPTAEEEGSQDHQMASDLKVPLRDLREMRERLSQQDVSIDFQPEGRTHHWEPVDHQDPLSLLEAAEEGVDDAPRVRAAIASLDARSRDILSSRWLSDSPMGLAELGERYGVSAERIRQIQERSFKQVRTALTADGSDRQFNKSGLGLEVCAS